MSLINSTAIPSGATGYELEQSLRFEDSRSTYLSRTPAADGNRKTWTLSYWIKRASISDHKSHFGGSLSGSASVGVQIQFDGGTQQLQIADYRAGYHLDWIAKSNAGFRDTSAWYHIVIAIDTTQSTASNRVKLYANGELLTLTTYTAPDLNEDTKFNQNSIQVIAASTDNLTATSFYEGYMSEVNFLDGVVASPADFGETGDYGEWKPIEYSGSYGTNGYYLPFKQDYTVEGFSSVLYTGNGGTQYIGGTGFQPDFSWIKRRNSSQAHSLIDAVRGGNKMLESQSTGAEASLSGGMAFKPDGFTLDQTGGWNEGNADGDSYVAWNWDMGGSNATNTAGGVNSTVRANPTYGQSIVSYTTSTANDGLNTIGHGLSSAPEMIIYKVRDTVRDWTVYHSGTSGKLELNNTDAVGSTGDWGGNSPTSTLFYDWLTGGGKSTIAYCFHSVTGYSKIGSYTGSGSVGKTVATGFKPAFVMIKRTDAANNWYIMDNVRTDSSSRPHVLQADTAETETTENNIKFTSTGFTINVTNNAMNASNATYIYMAFADTREYAYWLDQSGNNNDWTSNNLTESDVMVDSPTNNFPTWDALRGLRPSLWEGNLLTETSTNTISRSVDSNFRPVSGKWYVEVYIKVDGANSGQNATNVGVANDGFVAGDEFKGHENGVSYQMNGTKYLDTTNSAYGASYATGDIIGIAYDVDNSNVTFYKNGASQGAITSGWDGSNGRVVVATNSSTATGQRYAINFGQDSSFAGLKVAQGNQDGNSIGDFYYAPPTGFLALCTSNLPDVAVVPSEHFNPVIYTGNATARSITGVGFQPDFVWIKNRAAAESHTIYDVLRGVGIRLGSDYTDGDDNRGSYGLTAFGSDGFTIGTGGELNGNNQAIVSWNWKANGSGSSNTDGSINSTVSANADAGFSIATYTGNTAANITVGHGLNSAPELIFVKARGVVQNWVTYHSDLGVNKTVYLNATNAEITNTGYWGTVNASTWGAKSGGFSNNLSTTMIAYCFHSVDGYSKVGSYTGNGNADGTFIYTGFRPAFIMTKASSRTSHWEIHDIKRGQTQLLFANLNIAELDNSAYRIDSNANGVKIRNSEPASNGNNETYVYIAFAETPFKYSNAR